MCTYDSEVPKDRAWGWSERVVIRVCLVEAASSCLSYVVTLALLLLSLIREDGTLFERMNDFLDKWVRSDLRGDYTSAS